MQEVETPAIPIAPETAAEPATEEATPPAEPADAPVAEPAETPEEPTEEAPPTFDPESWKDNDTFKSWHEEQLEEARWTAQVEAMDKASQSIMTAETRKDEVIQAVSQLNQTLKEMSEAGQALDGTTFGRLLSKYAPNLNHIPQILAEGTLQPAVNQASAVATAQAMALIAGDDKELVEVAGRLVRNSGTVDAQRNPILVPSAEFNVDYGVKALKDFRKRFEKKAEERGYQRGLKDRTTATVEAQKVTQRNGKGPVEVKGATGGSRTEREELMDPTTPIERIMEIRARQKAG